MEQPGHLLRFLRRRELHGHGPGEHHVPEPPLHQPGRVVRRTQPVDEQHLVAERAEAEQVGDKRQGVTRPPRHADRAVLGPAAGHPHVESSGLRHYARVGA